MPTIILHTAIHSTLQICFDLSCSIDVHVRSTAQTNERAIAGRMNGLIGLGETVTWEAVHFLGMKQQLTSKITAMDVPFHFRDKQVKGIFKSMKHDHYFEQKDAFVLMNDIFVFESPLGIFGKLANL
jgi:ligand-binding SRPBCC domain-containing protein